MGRWQTQMARLFAERGHRVTIIGVSPPEVPMNLGENPSFETRTLYERRPPTRHRPRPLLGPFDPAVRGQEADKQATAELARRLVRLMSDEKLRDTLGTRARENVRRFAPDVITRRWEELFDFLER
ncbi:hypothetical protein ACFYZE_18635 [Streptomyces sp. NPDC001796]|uniref:hypothetical protein n=1 Tax=Streptomyces sp. NPDC001796 TaxID=3364609 RepID=UPI0036AB9558